MTPLVDARRLIGSVQAVAGSTAWCALTDAAAVARTVLGERISAGEVGQFVVVDADGSKLLGRIVEIRASHTDLRRHEERGDALPAEARVQLLGTVSDDGRADRGIDRYPLVGSHVYAARAESVREAVAAGDDALATLRLGTFGVKGIAVEVPVQTLFARHLAVLGSTGGGKSWTITRIAEAVADLGGKILLLDPTGEYSTLTDGVRHVVIGDDGANGTPVDVPHHYMREIDRIAFFAPAGAVQLPRMRDAMRRLRIAHVIETSEEHSPLLSDDGCIRHGASSTTLLAAEASFPGVADSPHAPFDLSKLADQLEYEASTGDGNTRNQVAPLLNRIRDILHIGDVMRVIAGNNGADLIKEIDTWLADDTTPVLRVSLADVPATHNLREIVVNIIGNQLLRRARQGEFLRAPLVLAVDEAHQFMGNTIGDDQLAARLDAFERIAKEGRKYGLNLCIATQRPSDLPSGLLSQVGMMIVHRLAEGRDRSVIQEAAAEMDLDALRFLPGLQQGEAVVMGVELPLPVTVRIQAPRTPPNSVGPNYTTTWAGRRRSPKVGFVSADEDRQPSAT